MVHIAPALVRDHYLLEKTPEHLLETVDSLAIVELPLPAELREQVRSPLDRTGNQLREETHVCEELDYVAGRLCPSLVNVYGIAQCLESVETDTDRQDKMKQDAVRFPVQEQVRERLCKEVVVLEHGENRQIDDYVQSTYPV